MWFTAENERQKAEKENYKTKMSGVKASTATVLGLILRLVL